MEQKKYSLFYYISVFLAGLFFFFVSDLAYFGRIAKKYEGTIKIAKTAKNPIDSNIICP